MDLFAFMGLRRDWPGKSKFRTLKGATRACNAFIKCANPCVFYIVYPTEVAGFKNIFNGNSSNPGGNNRDSKSITEIASPSRKGGRGALCGSTQPTDVKKIGLPDSPGLPSNSAEMRSAKSGCRRQTWNAADWPGRRGLSVALKSMENTVVNNTNMYWSNRSHWGYHRSKGFEQQERRGGAEGRVELPNHRLMNIMGFSMHHWTIIIFSDSAN